VITIFIFIFTDCTLGPYVLSHEPGHFAFDRGPFIDEQPSY